MNRILLILLGFLICPDLHGQWNNNYSKSGLWEENHKEGPDQMVNYFKKLYHPFSSMSADEMMQIKEAVRLVPDENRITVVSSDKMQAVNQWNCIGPFGTLYTGNPSTISSGRVLGIETSSGELRVLSASGNLWRYTNAGPSPIPVTISDSLNTPWANAFVTSPDDSAVIFIGTGEYFLQAGTGLWKTTDLGLSWNSIPMTPTPNSYFRILYDPQNSLIMHTATDLGYYRSTDGGTTWIRYLTGITTDLVIDALNPQTLYTVVSGDRFYKTVNGGLNWAPLAGGSPVTNVGRTALAICNANTNIIYANVTKNSDYSTMHIYKTTDAGATWDTCSLGLSAGGFPTTNFHGGQGWYNNVIAVHPQNCDLVFAGGVQIYRTTNGYHFTEPVLHRHADHHAFTWNNDATILYDGSDGGIFYTTNAGGSWNYNAYNNLPVTQFYHFDHGTNDPRTITGGTQDNGVQTINSGQTNWTKPLGGDGFGVAIDHTDDDDQYAILAWSAFISLDKGLTWNFSNAGGGYTEVIRTDYNTPAHVYLPNLTTILESPDRGITWTDIIPGGILGIINDISLSPGATPNIYAIISTGFPSRLWVRDAILNSWVQRDSGLPSTNIVRKVVCDRIQPHVAYALINGFNAGNKIFKTTDRGQTWINISGNLPDVPVIDMVVYPYNSDLLYLATTEGGFKSTNGGASWVRWNKGMPASIAMTELKAIDSIAINGTYWVRASTFGRSIWQREISGDDVVAVHSAQKEPSFLSVYYNALTNSLAIEYLLQENGNAVMEITDLTGRKVLTQSHTFQQRGLHRITQPLPEMNAGIYFIRMIFNNNSAITQRFLVPE